MLDKLSIARANMHIDPRAYPGARERLDRMENIDELQQAEAHLIRAEAELETAQREEREALQDIEKAVHEIEETKHHQEIEFTLDGEPEKTRAHHLTPNQIIIEYGHKDAKTHYLVEIKGTHKISFQAKGDEEIKMHDCMNFQTVSTGPTPVSYTNGPAAFIEGLRAQGYEAQSLTGRPDHVVFNYQIETGRLAGQTVRMGLVIPADFPNSTPSGPHVSPRLREAHPGNDISHPAGGVHNNQSGAFEQGAGGDWQYWSRPCAEWGQRKKTVDSYMWHIWRLWEAQ